MPRAASGLFTRVSNSFSEPVEGTIIDETDADTTFDDWDGGLSYTGLSFPSRADAIAADIDTEVDCIFLQGYETPGLGPAYYQRIATPAPVEAWQFQSNDGAYWQIVPTNGGVDFLQFNADPTGTTSSQVSITNAWECAIALGCELHASAYQGNATYKYSAGTNLFSENLTLRAFGRVTMRASGSGIGFKIDAGSDNKYNFNLLGDWSFRGDPTGVTTDGVYIRGVHQSTFEFSSWDCTTAYREVFGVGNRIKFRSALTDTGNLTSPATTLAASGTSGSVTLTAGSAVFNGTTIGFVGQKVWTSGGGPPERHGFALITAYTDSTHVTATVLDTLNDTAFASGSWGVGLIPTDGIVLEGRNVVSDGEVNTTTYVDAIVRGVSGTGVDLVDCDDVVIMGISEGNFVGYKNRYTSSAAFNVGNTFINLYGETNLDADMIDAGYGSTYINPNFHSASPSTGNWVSTVTTFGAEFFGGFTQRAFIEANTTSGATTASFYGTRLQSGLAFSGTGTYTRLNCLLVDGNFNYVSKLDDITATNITLGGTVTVGNFGTAGSAVVTVGTGSGLLLKTPVLPEANGGTNQSTYATGDTLYASAANTLSKLTGNITTTRKFLRQTGLGAASAAPVWDTVVAADVPGSALTKGDDTNVTLTLGGTPTTALLNAASITAGWTGQLALARGGSNANLTATAGGVLYSSSVAFAISSAGSSGQWLQSNGTSAPAFATIPITGTAYSKAARGASDQSLTDAGVTILVFDNEIQDPGNNYNNTTGKFTAPSTGDYLVSWTLLISGTAISTNNTFLTLNVGGSSYSAIPIVLKDTVGNAIIANGALEVHAAASADIYLDITISNSPGAVLFKNGSLFTVSQIR